MEPKITWPVSGNFPITFRFGEAPQWYLNIFGYPHNGIDIGCPEGTPVLACADGKVVYSDDIPDQDGKGLIVEHLWGISLYWHNSRHIAETGDIVIKGAMIAFSGKTGYVTGPHLHFGIKVKGVEIPGMKGWCNPETHFESTQPPVSIPVPQPRIHIVLPGQTLWGIAEKYYRNGIEWVRIYNANRDKISNPNLIRPFMKLLIP